MKRLINYLTYIDLIPMDLSQSDRVHKIIDLLGKDGGWCGVQKISDQSQIPRSLVVETIHQLVTVHQVQKQTDVHTKKNWYRINEVSIPEPDSNFLLESPRVSLVESSNLPISHRPRGRPPKHLP